jgi:hypothetical protein
MKMVIEEETKDSVVEISSFQQWDDDPDKSSLNDDETQRAEIGTLPAMNKANFANLQNIAKHKKASSNFQNYQAVSQSYAMRMEIGSSGVVAFEAKLKDGDLTALSNAVVMEVNFLAA